MPRSYSLLVFRELEIICRYLSSKNPHGADRLLFLYLLQQAKNKEIVLQDFPNINFFTFYVNLKESIYKKYLDYFLSKIMARQNAKMISLIKNINLENENKFKEVYYLFQLLQLKMHYATVVGRDYRYNEKLLVNIIHVNKTNYKSLFEEYSRLNEKYKKQIYDLNQQIANFRQYITNGTFNVQNAFLKLTCTNYIMSNVNFFKANLNQTPKERIKFFNKKDIKRIKKTKFGDIKGTFNLEYQLNFKDVTLRSNKDRLLYIARNLQKNPIEYTKFLKIYLNLINYYITHSQQHYTFFSSCKSVVRNIIVRITDNTYRDSINNDTLQYKLHILLLINPFVKFIQDTVNRENVEYQQQYENSPLPTNDIYMEIDQDF